MRRFLEVVLPWITSANVFWWFCCGVLLVCFILLGFILGGGGFISEPSLPPPFPPHNRLMSLLPLLHLTSTSTPKDLEWRVLMSSCSALPYGFLSSDIP